ncbi:hypothetical protein [Sulfitobacter mediterraneus]|jgi:hypothetical protein|uniref:DUF6854 domain-containing protein n=1 Tax=Sulfitobacter mediterraneus TaxID=83219 RepID=A0A2T6CD34_9RHOB|nr:hypothetical protein [Sulfitobacter mediterraneus]KIN79604.1 hypothetical protein Z950_138 [Sulfitobacter mediterraneus KCTC 32188]PTX73410.1 hypothetical protein C8N31_107111 [Sulfitobacter mediterraneus]
MSSNGYTLITVAKCDPGYLSKALEHVGVLAAELKSQAGALGTRHGVISTGEHAGSMVLFQFYSELNGIDRAFDVYGSSDAYQALIGSGKISVTLRNIGKMEDLGLKNTAAETPAYGVLTRWRSATPMTERMAPLVHLFEDNGAMVLRYGTIMTGSDAGSRLLGVGYPSMDAIEKTYDALRASKGYMDIIADIELDFRNIFRYAG